MNRRPLLTTLALGAALVAASGSTAAQVITVTTCDDAVDIPYWTGTLADLPGPDGLVSFVEALLVSDHEPGTQTIHFAIPESEWWLPQIFEGQVRLYSMLGWQASDTVIIDGTTQTDFTGDTNPDGHELGLDGLQLVLGGDGSVLTGFHGSNIYISGSNCEAYDNDGKMDFDIYNGSGSYIHDNDCDTIHVTNSNDNLIVRNVTERVRIDGWFAGGEPATGNVVGGPDPADRNYITGWGNYGEHGTPAGTTLELFDNQGTLVQNNWIGTTPDGMQVGNIAATVGVGLEGQNRDVLIRDNLVVASAEAIYPSSGHSGTPLYIEAYAEPGGFTEGIEVYNNTFGLNAAGEPLLGGRYGVLVSRYAQTNARDVRIGGPLPGQGNVIAGHDNTGVFMEISPGVPIGENAGIRVSGNSISAGLVPGFDGVGIDLTPDTWTFGPTANDPLDADMGANGLQNHPEVQVAEDVGSGLRVAGSLHSSPRDDFSIELFASPACDALGVGPGELFLGTTSVTTDLDGDAAFDVVLPVSAEQGWVVTATATLEPLGRTSEFSACAPVTLGDHCQADLGFGGPGALTWQICGEALASGGSAVASLAGAPAFAAAWFVFGVDANPTPFQGGQLVPVPMLGLVGVTADATGQVGFPISGGGGPGTLITQWAVTDGATWSLSNALQVEVLP